MLLAGALLASGVGLAGCLAFGSQHFDVLIGSDIPYRPFEYRTADGTGPVTGFDVGVAEAVFTERMNLTVGFKSVAFPTIIPALNDGDFRAIMSAMTITSLRATQVDFSVPYFTAYQTVLVLRGSDILTVQDLAGRAVGVQKGTTGEGAAEALQARLGGHLTIKAYDQIAPAFDALRNGQVAAVINDNTVILSYHCTHANSTRLLLNATASGQSDAPPYLTLTVEHYGIAFRKGDPLLPRVNAALRDLVASPEYHRLNAHYFATCPAS